MRTTVETCAPAGELTYHAEERPDEADTGTVLSIIGDFAKVRWSRAGVNYGEDVTMLVKVEEEPVPEVKTINITPTWSGILPALLAVVTNADSAEARKSAEAELRTMAFAADKYNEAVKLIPGLNSILYGERD